METKSKRRARTGTTGEGDYYRIIVRPKWEFADFRYHDVGEKGHIQRLAGLRENGNWDTHAWLIAKTDAHLHGGRIIADSEGAREVLEQLSSEPVQVKEDLFEAHDRINIPERLKPTKAQKKAWAKNIKKTRSRA